MCIRLTLLLLLQGEQHWKWLENLKVYYELSKFGYYKIRNNWSTIYILNCPFSKLFAKQSWHWCSYKTKRLVYCYKVRAFSYYTYLNILYIIIYYYYIYYILLLYILYIIYIIYYYIYYYTFLNIFYNLFEGIDICLTQQLRCPWVSDKVEWYFKY